MSRDPRDPAYDDRRYCEACLTLLSEDWLREHDSDAWPECPRCKRGIDRCLTHAERDTERAIRRADHDRDCAKDERATR